MARLACAALLLWGMGCALSRPKSECVSHGGNPWVEIRTTHFRIRTNLAVEAARKTAIELEQYRHALSVAWGKEVDPPGRLETIVLKRHGDLAEFADDAVAGYVYRTTAEISMVIAGEGHLDDASPRADHQRHELAHYLNAFVLFRQPRWLSEGLASYLQWVRLENGGTQAAYGLANRDYVLYARRRGTDSIQDLWNWREFGSGSALTRKYVSSWLWVHFLFNAYEQRFLNFLSRLADAEEPHSAWDRAFEGIPDDQLNRELILYRSKGKYVVSRVELAAAETELTLTPVSDAEVHAIRARLWLSAPGNLSDGERASRMRQEIARALAIDPLNAEALELQLEFLTPWTKRLKPAEALTHSHPTEGKAWAQLAMALGMNGNSPQWEQALEHAGQNGADQPGVLNIVAWQYATHDKADLALEPARKAVTLAPWSPAIVDTYAKVLGVMGRCTEAVRMQQRAIELLPEEFSAEHRVPYERHLAEYRRCQEGGPPPPDASPVDLGQHVDRVIED